MNFEKGRIKICGHNSKSTHQLTSIKFEEVGVIIDTIMKECTKGDKIGGTFVNVARGFSVRLGQ